MTAQSTVQWCQANAKPRTLWLWESPGARERVELEVSGIDVPLGLIHFSSVIHYGVGAPDWFPNVREARSMSCEAFRALVELTDQYEALQQKR